MLNTDSNVLLLRVPNPPGQNEAFWQPITGGVEPGETALEAAVREIEEETGLRIAEAELSLIDSDFPVIISPELTISKTVYSLRTTITDIRLNPPEHEKYKWATPSEVSGHLTWESNQQTWLRVFARHQRLFDTQAAADPDETSSAIAGEPW